MNIIDIVNNLRCSLSLVISGLPAPQCRPDHNCDMVFGSLANLHEEASHGHSTPECNINMNVT